MLGLLSGCGGGPGYESKVDELGRIRGLSQDDYADQALEFFLEAETPDGQALSLEELFLGQPWESEGLDLFLETLDTATTNEGNLGSVEARTLASAAVSLLAQRSRGEDLAGNEVQVKGKRLKVGDLSPKACVHLVHILGTYMQSVEYYIGRGSEEKPKKYGIKTITRKDFGTAADMPVFNYADLKEVARLALGTAEGFAGMRQVVTSYEDALAYQVILRFRNAGLFDPFSNFLATADATLEAFFLGLMRDGLKVDGLDSDFQFYVWTERLPYVGDRRSPVAGMGEGATIVEYMAKQEVNPPPKYMNGGAEIELGPAIGNTHRHRQYGITGVLYETKTIENLDTLMAGYEDNHTFDEDWFANGFPDLETVSKNRPLQFIILALAGEGGLNMNDYRVQFAQAWEGESNN